MKTLLLAALLLAFSPTFCVAADSEPIASLVDRLNEDKDPSKVVEAVKQLGQLKPFPRHLVPILAHQLEIERHTPTDLERHLAVIAALRDLGAVAKPAVPAIIEWYGRIGPNSGKPAIDALHAICPNHADSIRVISYRDDLRLAGALLLMASEPETRESVPLLVEGLSDGNAAIRVAAAKSLYTLETKARAATPALVKALRDDDSRVRAAGASALGRVGEKRRLPATERRGSPSFESPEHAWVAPEEAVPALVAALKDTELSVRLQAARSLLRSGPEALGAAVPVLSEGLRSEKREFRALAAYALRDAETLGSLGSDARFALPELERAKKDKDPSVAAAASAAIVKIRPADGKQPAKEGKN